MPDLKKAPYTPLQVRIINGEIPIEDMRCSDIANLINKVKLKGDTVLAERLEKLHKEVTEFAKARTLEAHYFNNKRFFSSPAGKEVGWYDVYTERQERVIKGYISYEKASEADYRRIAEVARSVEDFVLAEKMDALADEKRRDNYAWARSEERESYFVDRDMDVPPVPTKRDYLKQAEIEVVMSFRNPDELSLRALEGILEVAQRIGDETAVKVMQFLVAERKDRSIIYKAKTKEEAFQLLQSHTMFKITRPEDWVPEENKKEE